MKNKEEKEEVEYVDLVVAEINATSKILYWKNENEILLQIGEYVIVENKGGFDLAKVLGMLTVEKKTINRLTYTDYARMGNVVKKV